jgi:hypothetical protein
LERIYRDDDINGPRHLKGVHIMRILKAMPMLLLAAILLLPSSFNIIEEVEGKETHIPTREGESDFHLKAGSEINITESKKFNTSFYYPVPDGSSVLSASMSISVHPRTPGGGDYPEDVAINFAKSKREYEYKNEETVFQGAWGKNFQTTDGARFNSVVTSAGSTKLRFALPENCTVTGATIDINGSQRDDYFNITNTTLVTSGGHFGEVMKKIGDSNGDGIEEVLVGAPNDNLGAGKVYHLDYPLPSLPLEPVLYASTTQSNANFGASISDLFSFPDTGLDGVAIGAPKDGIGNPGSVRLYSYSPFGTQTSERVLISGNNTGDLFGSSVEACDFDDDDDPEIFVGAPDAEGNLGVVYMFEVTSSSYELITALNGTGGEFHFGREITVGDMNGDNVDDLIIASDEKVRIYFGDSSWDLVADITIDPDSDSGQSTFGHLECLGDTGSGSETLGIGVPTSTSGSILLYDGGSGVDSTMDLQIVPGRRIVGFGSSFSAGDMDNDNVNEIIVGAPGTTSTKGEVVVMKRSGSTLWKSLTTPGVTGDMFGYSVCIANLRGDTFADPISSAPQFFGTSSTGAGMVYLFEYYDIDTLPSNTPFLKIGTNTIWTYDESHLSGTVKSGNIASAINSYIASRNTPDYSSDYEGFIFVDITFDAQTTSSIEGSNMFNLTNFDIRYDQTIDLGDLSGNMNSFLAAYDDSLLIMDGQKFIPVPLSVSADTPGRFIVESFQIDIDEIPFVQNDPEEIHVLEDSKGDRVYNLYDIFQDNNTQDSYLNISVRAIGSNAKFVDVYITDHKYLGVDLTNKTDDLGRNWSGSIDLSFTVQDERNGTLTYTGIDLVVDEVNDAPALKTMPGDFIFQDSMFIYTPQLRDDEGDDINLTIDEESSPGNMTVDYVTGTISWQPNKWEVGFSNYTVILSDGNATRTYIFQLEVRDEPDNPVFITPPPNSTIEVLVGTTFSYNFTALDPDIGDRVTYIIVFPVQGAGIDVQTGLFTWTPPQHYPQGVDFVVRARDQGGLTTDLEFSMNTTFTDTPPELLTNPLTSLFDTEEWAFNLNIIDAEEHRLEIQLVEGPAGMEYDEVTQNVTWTPDVDQIGDFNLSIKVTSTVYVLYFNYTLNVQRAQRYWTFSIQGIEDGDTFKGDVKIGGELELEPSTIEKVEIRLGEGDWMVGTYSEGRWSYTLKTKDFEDGEYSLQVRAYDGAVYSDIETVSVKIKNEEEKTSPLIYILIIIAVIVVIGIIIGIFLFIKKLQDKKEAEEQEKQRKEALEASKRSMDDFIKTTGSDLDGNVDYSSMEIEGDQEGGKNLEKIDEIFQPLNIPKEEIPQSDMSIPEDPLQSAGMADTTIMEGVLPIDETIHTHSENMPPVPPEVHLPANDQSEENDL